MLDKDFAIAALKEYGAPIILIAAIVVFKQAGLLDIASLNEPITMGIFLAVSSLIIIGIMLYFQNVSKVLRTSYHGTGTNHELTVNLDEIKQSIKDTYNVVYQHGGQSEQMHYLLVDMLRIIKGIPNKSLILESLVVYTRALLNECLEAVLDYTVSCNGTTFTSEILKRSQSKLNRSFTKIKINYLESASKISRTMLNDDLKKSIETLLDNFFSSLYDISTSTNIPIEDVFFKTNNNIKDLEDTINSLFKEHLISPSSTAEMMSD